MDTLKEVVSSHNLRVQRPKNFQRSISWRALLILIVISLLVSLIGLALPTPALAQHEGEQTAEFLPPDTDFYFTVNLDPGGDQLTKFWKLVNNWWQDPNVQAKWGELLGQIETENDIDITEDVLPWLGLEIAVGMRNLIPAGEGDPEMILFVGTMDEDASEAFFLDKLMPIIMGEEPPTGPSGDYHGIDTLYAPDADVYLAFPEEYIMWSNNQALLESSLDLILSPNPAVSLAGTANFQEAQANLPERVGMFYCNYEHIWEESIESIPEEEQDVLSQAMIVMIEAFSDYVPSYFAASLYFTDSGISTTAYYPLPDGMTFSTEPDLLKSTHIVPHDALLFASDQNVNAYWQGLKPHLQATWLELVSTMVSTLTADLFEMPLEEAIAYLDETLELNLDELWEGIAPVLGELSGMTFGEAFEEAIAYLDETLGLNLGELWEGIAPMLGELSGMSFEEALAYLDETLGLNELWAEITPVLGELSGMSFGEVVAFHAAEILGLNLDELWEGIAPVLGELSGMTFEEAVAYLDETFDLNLDEWWAASPVAGKILLPGMTFEEAVAYLDETLDELWAEITPVLGGLSEKSFEEAIAYLDETLGLNLGELWAGIAPVLGELSGMTFEEAVAYLGDVLGLNLGELWAGIAPVLGELSGMTFEEAIAYLGETLEGLNLGELWAEITPHLGELSEKSFGEAIAYLDETLELNLGELWVAIPSMIEELALESFEGAAACLDQVLSGMTGEFSMALLPLSPHQMPDILLMFEVDDPAGVQQNLDNIISAMDPWLLQVSEVSINGVTATMFTDYYIAESGASPGYLFLDVDTTHYLVIGSTEDALRAAVEASQDSVLSLNEAEEYQGVLSLLPQTRMDLGYLNITQLLNTIVSQIPTEGMSVEDFELLVDSIPLKGALAYSSALIDTEGVTMTGALYLLPPPLIVQEVPEGMTGTMAIPEQAVDFSQLDIEVGRSAVSIDVDITNAPEEASIKVTAMKELPEEIISGFELAATDAGVSIVDVAYGIRVDKPNLTADNIGTATITMKVSRTWADTYGVDNVKIFRISDGTREILPTTFTGYEGDYAVFVGTSENGLSTFGLVALSPLATAFVVSDLSISPSEVKTGESVTITAIVTNTSVATGTYTVSLKLDGEVVDTKGVTLAGGASETVSFTVTKGVTGTYSVEIDGLSDSLTVTSEAGANWGLIGGIIGGVIVVAAIVAVMLLRRRRAVVA